MNKNKWQDSVLRNNTINNSIKEISTSVLKISNQMGESSGRVVLYPSKYMLIGRGLYSRTRIDIVETGQVWVRSGKECPHH